MFNLYKKNMANYFNEIPFRTKLAELGKCDFMDRSEFVNGCNYLKGKKVVILGRNVSFVIPFP